MDIGNHLGKLGVGNLVGVKLFNKRGVAADGS